MKTSLVVHQQRLELVMKSLFLDPGKELTGCEVGQYFSHGANSTMAKPMGKQNAGRLIESLGEIDKNGI